MLPGMVHATTTGSSSRKTDGYFKSILPIDGPATTPSSSTIVGNPSDPTSAASRKSLHSQRLQAATMHALPSYIDPDLLRAVPVTTVLSGFGRHWKSNAGRAEDYALSKRVEEIDYFLSHDWGTPRWEKTLSLCLLYNGRTASIISLMLAVPLALIGGQADVPRVRGHLATLVSPIIFFTLLMFGQRLLGSLGRSSTVFLDKLCIHQVDEGKKTAGILGLAGFLKASQRLVLVWSPRYFSRLWCTYELVTWCFLHGLDASKVDFLPVASSILQFTAVVSFTANQVIKSIIRVYRQEENDLAERISGLTISFMVCVVVGFAQVPIMSNLRRLKEQVGDFRIRESKCFCCTHDHIHPETGQQMSCDRQLVYSTLYTWYLHSGGFDEGTAPAESPTNVEATLSKRSIEDALDCFDDVVGHELSRIVTQSMNKNRALLFLTYEDCVRAALPSLWGGFDFVSVVCHDGHYLDALRWFVEYLTLPLCVFPLGAAVAIRWGSRVERMTAGIQPALCRTLLCSMFFVCLFFVTMMILWLPGQFLTSLASKPSLGLLDLLLLLRHAGLAALTVYVMRATKAARSRSFRTSWDSA
eukprot:TRINITY_DN112075_c0_g1_i1.p1 TRINITY_DN112075_c0_g1~~TRINITY_DN112075_c0_g1_i1.p1  ORF type:complete len:585 (-),score=30.98 TRINITY_DN112075_c0_g1_i1:216-1970(-)